MTSLVATGVASEGSNASRTPALPVGWAEGDLLLIMAAIRNSGAGVPNAPAGYSTLLDMSNCKIFGKVAGSSESDPTVTFTGGVANATCHAQMAAIRGPRTLAVDGTAAQLNASAQNVAYPAGPALTAFRVFTIFAIWKQDDWTSVSVPGGAIGTVSTTTGDDAAFGWAGTVLEAPPIAGSATVTGGAAAISRGGILNLVAVPDVTVTEQDSYPPRAQIAVTNLEDGDAVEIWRVVAGQYTLVRSGATVADDPAFVIIDAEMPFGVPVRYSVFINGHEFLQPPITFTLPGGLVVLSDAITGGAAECIIGAAGDRTYTRDSYRARAGGQNVMVAGFMPLGPDAQPAGEGAYELLALTTSAVTGIKDLVANATQGILQLRTPGVSQVTGDPYEGFDAYLAVDRITERKFSQDGSDPRRLLTIEYSESIGWAPGLEAAGFTLQDIDDYFGNTGTLQDIVNLFGTSGTLLDIALADWTP